jgi:hypothetical protein
MLLRQDHVLSSCNRQRCLLFVKPSCVCFDCRCLAVPILFLCTLNSSGGLLFTMRTARRQWVRHATTRGPFYLDTSAHAKRLGISADMSRAASPSGRRGIAQLSQDELNWNTTHAALTAAGLSEDEIVAFAASMPANKPHLAAAAASHTSRPDSRSGVRPDDAAVLDTADAELAAHIIAHSVASLDNGRGSCSSSRSSSRAGRDEHEGLPDLAAAAAGASAESDGSKAMSKFLRDFEPQALDLASISWGMNGEASRWE